jgi:selenocysteine-specific elongation factor
MRRRLLELVDAEHAATPLADGAPLQTIRARLGVAAELAGVVVSEALAAGLLEQRGALLRRAGWQPTLDADDARLADVLRTEIQAGGAAPPTVAELAGRHGARASELLRLLARRGELMPVGAERYYDPPVLQAVLARLAAGMRPGLAYAPAELRELLGLPRRLAVPLLEHADAVGVTVRRPEGRLLAVPAGQPPVS